VVVDALQKLCHDAAVLAAGGAARYFPTGSVRADASIEALSGWQRELSRVARHDEHPWNEGLLLDALLAQGCRALAPPARAPARAPLDTLAP
jgi:DNA polymerase-3 subunit delta'